MELSSPKSLPAVSMRRLQLQFRSGEIAAIHGPALIAAGLLVLLAAVWWPAVPTMTAMTLVAFGATGATLARFRGRAAAVPVLILHLAVYGGLYVLFVGATLHASAQANAGIGLPATIDLAASLGPAAATLCVLGDVVRSTSSTD
jgi:hypothetical protein